MIPDSGCRGQRAVYGYFMVTGTFAQDRESFYRAACLFRAFIYSMPRMLLGVSRKPSMSSRSEVFPMLFKYLFSAKLLAEGKFMPDFNAVFK